jgi:hypothetical protein
MVAAEQQAQPTDDLRRDLLGRLSDELGPASPPVQALDVVGQHHA